MYRLLLGLFMIGASAFAEVKVGDVAYYVNAYNPPPNVSTLEKVTVVDTVQNNAGKAFLVESLRSKVQFVSEKDRLLPRAAQCMYGLGDPFFPNDKMQVCEADEVAYYAGGRAGQVYRKGFVESFWTTPDLPYPQMMVANTLLEIKDAATGETRVMPVNPEDSSFRTNVAMKISRNFGSAGHKVCYDTTGKSQVPFVVQENNFSSADFLCEADVTKFPAGNVTGIFKLLLTNPADSITYFIQVSGGPDQIQYLEPRDIYK